MHAAALASLLAALLGSASAANPTKFIFASKDAREKPSLVQYTPSDDVVLDVTNLALFFDCQPARGNWVFSSGEPIFNQSPVEGSICLNPELSVFTVEGFKNPANKANRALIIEKATNVSFKAWKAFLGPKNFRKIVASITKEEAEILSKRDTSYLGFYLDHMSRSAISVFPKERIIAMLNNFADKKSGDINKLVQLMSKEMRVDCGEALIAAIANHCTGLKALTEETVSSVFVNLKEEENLGKYVTAPQFNKLMRSAVFRDKVSAETMANMTFWDKENVIAEGVKRGIKWMHAKAFAKIATPIHDQVVALLSPEQVENLFSELNEKDYPKEEQGASFNWSAVRREAMAKIKPTWFVNYLIKNKVDLKELQNPGKVSRLPLDVFSALKEEDFAAISENLANHLFSRLTSAHLQSYLNAAKGNWELLEHVNPAVFLIRDAAGRKHRHADLVLPAEAIQYLNPAARNAYLEVTSRVADDLLKHLTKEQLDEYKCKVPVGPRAGEEVSGLEALERCSASGPRLPLLAQNMTQEAGEKHPCAALESDSRLSHEFWNAASRQCPLSLQFKLELSDLKDRNLHDRVVGQVVSFESVEESLEEGQTFKDVNLGLWKRLVQADRFCQDLSAARLNELDEPRLAALTALCVSVLPGKSKIAAAQWKSMTPAAFTELQVEANLDLIPLLSVEQFAQLSAAVEAGRKNWGAAITAAQMSKLSADHFAKAPATLIASLTPAAFTAMSKEQLVAIPALHLRPLTRTQLAGCHHLASLTAEQVQNLGTNHAGTAEDPIVLLRPLRGKLSSEARKKFDERCSGAGSFALSTGLMVVSLAAAVFAF